MATVSLKSLVEAMASAVAAAQAELSRSQIIDLGRYFEKDSNAPRLMKLQLPSLKPGDNGKLVTYGVPLLTLNSPAQLRIKTVDFEFEVDLGDLGEPESADVTVAEDFGSNFRRLAINPQPSLLGRRNSTRVTLTVEAVEQSEGLARLIGELNKMHGPIDPATPGDPAPLR